MMGIARPDLRPPEVKAAAERISIGYGTSGLAIFVCTECLESAWFPTEIKHTKDCNTGRVLGSHRAENLLEKK